MSLTKYDREANGMFENILLHPTAVDEMIRTEEMNKSNSLSDLFSRGWQLQTISRYTNFEFGANLFPL